MQRGDRDSGFTLVEVMIVIAILAILSAIAIPAYNGYMLESKRAAARSNAEPLRLALESYWLDNGTYPAFTGGEANWDPNGTKTLETEGSPALNWHPSGDEDQYIYTVDVNGDSWGILVENKNDDTAWARVQKGADGRMSSCYDDTDGATTGACPAAGS
jgi:type IV pilus assembly protein PilE